MGSILMVFAGVVYYREVQDRLQAFDDTLYRKSKAIATQAPYQLYRNHWLETPEDAPILEGNPVLIDSELVYVRWYNSKGKLVKFVGSTFAPKQLTVAPGFQTINSDRNSRVTSSEQWLRQVTLPVLQGKVLIGYLQVATPLTPIRENLAQGRLFLTLGVPVTLGLIGLTGWFLGGIAMQPVRRSYEQLQRFTADASHELRSPLAAVQSNAQVGLLASVDDGEAGDA